MSRPPALRAAWTRRPGGLNPGHLISRAQYRRVFAGSKTRCPPPAIPGSGPTGVDPACMVMHAAPPTTTSGSAARRWGELPFAVAQVARVGFMPPEDLPAAEFA